MANNNANYVNEAITDLVADIYTRLEVLDEKLNDLKLTATTETGVKFDPTKYATIEGVTRMIQEVEYRFDAYDFDVEINGSTTVSPEYVPEYKEANDEQ
jgi:D-serine dehydratase